MNRFLFFLDGGHAQRDFVFSVNIQHATLVQQVNTETKGYMIEYWILSVKLTELRTMDLVLRKSEIPYYRPP